ncbi:MAG TPA: glycine betaine/L-proline ABC transporter ATP-binding protein [Actinomycetota bacterium]|nr:glycine betaine/L-proline ABC transporter ATP-binding protein [Actinomycetota bacterium]
MAPMEPKIRFEDVIKIFGPRPSGVPLELLRGGATKERIFRETGHVVAVAGVSLDVAEGEIFVVMGLSGSGKSTLVRLANRLVEPTAGRVLIDGRDIVGLADREVQEIRRTKMAMVFQHFALFPHMTVAENAAYGLKARGVEPRQRRERALEVLAQVGLAEWADHYPRELSGGMQQRVGLARALAPDPDILLMDEAFSALDPLIRRRMQDELLEIQSRVRKTILFVTHDMDEALRLGDRVAIMRDGRIVQVGTPAEIVATPADGYVAAFVADVDRARVVQVAFVMRDAPAVRDEEVAVDGAARAAAATGACFVVDADGRPVALVTARPGEIRRDFERVVETAVVADLFGRFRSGLPVAVVDEQGRLRGMVGPTDLLAALGRLEEVVASGPGGHEADAEVRW